MSDEQTKPGIKWVPLAEAPFKLRFGWDLPESADENDRENEASWDLESGSARISWYRDRYFIECCDSAGTIGATIPIGLIAYLGMDAALPGMEIAAKGKIVSWERTQGAMETASRLAVLEGQLGLRARKSLDGDFTPIPASAVPELKITNWRKGWGEYSTGERLFDIQNCLLKTNEAELDHTFSRRLLMTIDPKALRQIQPDYLTMSTSEDRSHLSAPSEGTQSKEPRGSRTKNKKRKHPHRPSGSGYQKSDYPLVDEMRTLLIQGLATSATQAAASLVKRAAGSNTTDASKIRRLVGRYKERFPDAS